jgi:hypothetical protein
MIGVKNIPVHAATPRERSWHALVMLSSSPPRSLKHLLLLVLHLLCRSVLVERPYFYSSVTDACHRSLSRPCSRLTQRLSPPDRARRPRNNHHRRHNHHYHHHNNNIIITITNTHNRGLRSSLLSRNDSRLSLSTASRCKPEAEVVDWPGSGGTNASITEAIDAEDHLGVNQGHTIDTQVDQGPTEKTTNFVLLGRLYSGGNQGAASSS